MGIPHASRRFRKWEMHLPGMPVSSGVDVSNLNIVIPRCFVFFLECFLQEYFLTDFSNLPVNNRSKWTIFTRMQSEIRIL